MQAQIVCVDLSFAKYFKQTMYPHVHMVGFLPTYSRYHSFTFKWFMTSNKITSNNQPTQLSTFNFYLHIKLRSTTRIT